MHVGNNYMIYSFFEAIHIISVIAWMAGLLYLPRLFVYHSDDLIKKNKMPKGDPIALAEVSAILGVKKTSEIIPLCHPLMLTSVSVDFEIDIGNNKINIMTECRVNGATGVEMEALTAASVAGLTIYDMCKAVDKEMSIGPFFLNEKSGGKSGHFIREES
mgnify:CR=1 FL=1